MAVATGFKKTNVQKSSSGMRQNQNLFILVFSSIGKPIFSLLVLVLEFISQKKALPKRKTKKVKKVFSFVKLLGYFKVPAFKPNINSLLLPSLAITCLSLFVYYIFFKLPSAHELMTRKIELTTKIYDRNGILLYSIYKDKNRSLITLSSVPDVVKKATLAAEDSEFYSHPGISIKGIMRALWKNWREEKRTGGSTITQQLVKNVFLTSEKTITRKIKEAILAFKVEATYSKDEILEMYLNEVSYGGSAYGISEAARVYFGKRVSELTLSEAALLAGLPQAPSKYSPFGGHSDMVFERQKEVLNLMKENGYITEEEEKSARNQVITFSSKKTPIKAPHFVMYVKEYLEERYGKEAVETGGMEVITTLDYNIQQQTEKIVKNEILTLKNMHVTNGAAVIINPQTGEILSMVGSSDYFDMANGGNFNVATSLRPPGSSIKVVNYIYALENGFTPASIIEDLPITFKSKYTEDYTPKNYDGKYKGNITLRKALAESRNIPAVKVLNSIGVQKMIDQGKKMGITSWEDEKRFGLSLTLGGGETKLVELAGVYAILANGGKKVPVSPILRVTNYKNKILEKNNCSNDEGAKKSILNYEVSAYFGEYIARNCKETQVVDPRVAFIITDILKDNEARSGSFGINSQLVVKGHPEVAVKTGTSNSLRDNLTIGYTKDLLVAVWVGNNDNSPMSRVASGVTGASPIWNKIMTYLLDGNESTQWSIPDGLVNLPICTLTGTLSCGGCSNKMEWFLKENTPKTRCHSETVEKIRKDLTEKGLKTGEIIERSYSTINRE